ncbi:MAG: cobaltochelatase subunit CobT, partial [Hyphomicrobiales bacterium]|nr:cobaltochelatase subunit CobT [Hyphomicrobiales bacterium]
MTLISNRKPGAPRPAPTEPLKQAVAGCMRALARRPEIEIVYASDKPALFGAEKARLPEPPRKPSAEDVAVLRGHAASMALKLACHDPAVHRRLAPQGPEARALFDCVEQARVEAIGAKRMQGVASNLSAMLQDRYHRGAKYEDITDRADAPIEDAVALMVRERLTGEPPPPAARKIVDLWRAEIEAKAGTELDRLDGKVDDQRAFARIIRDVLAHLDMAEAAELDNEEDADSDDDQSDEDKQQDGEESEEGSSREQAEMESSEASAEDLEEGMSEDSDSPTGELPEDAEEADSEEASEAWRPPVSGPNERRGPDYRAYLTKFDEVIAAEEL